MTEDAQARHRRRTRQKPAAAAGRGQPSADADVAPTSTAPPAKSRKSRRDSDPAERGLRDLVGAGRSQLGVSGALRGRDVNRPTEQDIGEAEETLVIVRRNWKPPAS